MSNGRARLSSRAKKRRQRRIVLVICTVVIFFTVTGGLLYLLKSTGNLPWFSDNQTESPEESSSEDDGYQGETGESGENGETGGAGDETGESDDETVPPETEPPVLTIEDVWANDTRTPVEAKGVYLSASSASNTRIMDYVITLLDTTEINAVVIDIKDDGGYLTVDLDIPLADEVGATSNLTFTRSQMETLLDELKEHGAYLIARIAAFRDIKLAQARTDCSLWWKESSVYGHTVYQDSQGFYWLDPGNETVQQYLLDVSQAAVDLGFDEIQYDYVRFPTTYIGRVDYYGGTGYYLEDGVTYNEEAATLRKDAVASFVERACRLLVPQGVFVSADVYGIIINSDEDAGNVGQDYVELAKWLDYICPMVYPSHYTSPIYGVTYPDTEPYTIVNGAMKDSVYVLSELTNVGDHCAEVRPWIQAFTADWLADGTYLKYGGAEVREQLNAVYDAGYAEWILWNAPGNYQYYSDGLLPKE